LLQASAGATARVLGRFRRVIDLALGDDIFALVLPAVGNGPFHAVIDHFPPQTLPDVCPVQVTDGGLWLGPWGLRMTPGTEVWDPRPAWEALVPQAEGLAVLRHVAEDAARARGDLAPLGACLLGGSLPFGMEAKFPIPIKALAKLAGWGPGLTPSGDDFLAGVMLGLWLRRGADAAADCAQIYAAAAPRTTRLSRAFLRAACDGLTDERWHILLRALTLDDTAGLERAVRAVLSFGATSGLDMVSGFLWLLEGKNAIRNR